jgi:tetratricopeptide (TPR) repeat protein
MDRDKNLLFGVVAVQYEQVTPADFVRAVEAWANDPVKDVSSYLVGADTLSESDRDFVNRLVEKELERGGGDAAAALERVGGDEAIHDATHGVITLIGSHGLKMAPPEQHRLDLPVAQPIEGKNPGARNAYKTESVDWRPVGFAVVAVMLVSGFALYSYLRAMDEKNDARDALRIAGEQLESAERQRRLDQEALLLAEGQRKIIERERNVAKRQKDIALEAIIRNILEIPEAAAASHALLRENISALDSIFKLEPESLDLEIERSANQALIGSLWRRRGELSESVKAFETALAIAKRVSLEWPEESLYRGTLARRHRDLGAAYSDFGSYDGALAEFKNRLRITQELLEAGPSDKLKEELARAHVEVGNVLSLQGDSTRAAESHERSLSLNERMLESVVEYDSVKRNVESPKFIEIYEEAVALWSKFLESNGRKLENQTGLIQSKQNLGLVYAYYGLLDRAQSQLSESLRAYQKLSTGDPPEANLLDRQARIYYELGLVHSIRGSFETAKSAYESGISIAESLVKSNPERATMGHALATYTFALGRLHLSLREYGRASLRFEQMLSACQTPSAKEAVIRGESGPIYPMYTQALHDLRHASRSEEALKLQESYIELLLYFSQRGPDDEHLLAQLADAHINFGLHLRRDEQTDHARRAFMAALDILEAQASKYPDDVKLRSKIEPIQLRLSRLDRER